MILRGKPMPPTLLCSERENRRTRLSTPDYSMKLAAQFMEADRVIQEGRQRERERQERISGRFDAEDIYKHLINRVDLFQKTLGDLEEIGLQLANFGIAAQIHIRSIGYQNPNLIEFSGVNADGHEVTLVQHISQLNFLLIAVKPLEEKPYRIGFR